MMVSAARAVFLVMSGTLIVSAVLLLYTVSAYAHNVMYSRGVRLHATALLLLTVGWLFADALSFGLVPEGLELLPDAFFVLAAAVFVAAVWEFARDVVDLPEGDEDAFDATVSVGTGTDWDRSDTDAGGSSVPLTDDDAASATGAPVPPALASLGGGTQALASVESVGLPIERLPDTAFENLLVVSVGRTPDEIESVVRRRGRVPERVGVVPVSGTDVDYDGPMWCAPRVRPNDLTGISMRFSKGLEYVKPGAGWVLFDNITAMLIYGDADRVYRLVDSLVSATRSRNARGVFAIVREATADDTYARFRNLYDVEVEFG